VKIKVAGFQKNSFIDYPGMVASVIFLGGCNMRCYYCHNFEILAQDSNTKDFDEILSQLSEQIGFIDGVVITGGEAALHPHIVHVIKEVKLLGLLVKLDTNGTNSKLIKQLVEDGLVDYVAMDIKAPLDKYEEVTCAKVNIGEIRSSIQYLISQEKVDYMFRTTLAPILSQEDFQQIGIILRGAKCFQLQQFVPNNFSNSHKVVLFPHTKKDAQGFADIVSKYVNKVIMRGFD